MASSIVINIAGLKSTVVLAKDDATVAQILRWFIQDWATPADPALTQAQQNQYYLDQANAHIVDMIRQEAKRVHLRDLAIQQQALDDQASSDVAI